MLGMSLGSSEVGIVTRVSRSMMNVRLGGEYVLAFDVCESRERGDSGERAVDEPEEEEEEEELAGVAGERKGTGAGPTKLFVTDDDVPGDCLSTGLGSTRVNLKSSIVGVDVLKVHPGRGVN